MASSDVYSHHSAARNEKFVHGETMPLNSELCTFALAVFGFGIGVFTCDKIG